MSDTGDQDPFRPPPAGWSGPPRPDPQQPQQPQQPPFGAPPASQPPPGPPRAPGPVDAGGRKALALGLTSLVLVPFFFPLALVLGPAAVIVGVRAQNRAQRKQGRAPGAAGGIVTGAIAAVLAAGAAAVVLLVFDEFADYTDCRSGANTQIARQNCEDELRRRLEDRFGVRLGS